MVVFLFDPSTHGGLLWTPSAAMFTVSPRQVAVSDFMRTLRGQCQTSQRDARLR